MAPSFRDRFFTPPVARAMTSPSGILAAGVGGAAGMLTGVIPLAVLGVVAGWAIRVRPRHPTDTCAGTNRRVHSQRAVAAAHPRRPRSGDGVPRGGAQDTQGTHAGTARRTRHTRSTTASARRGEWPARATP